MKNLLLLFVFLLSASCASAQVSPEVKSLYFEVSPPNLSVRGFDYAIKGYEHLKAQGKVKNEKLTIIDFTQDSNEKRLYTLDMRENPPKLIFNSLVSHGSGSEGSFGSLKFSNIPESRMSSLGFYAVGERYKGIHGYSLRLHGLEKGYNDNALKRTIVIHSADYVSDTFITDNGRIGRSGGCPAVPQEVMVPMIKEIKEGSILFIYYNDGDYLKNSEILNPKYELDPKYFEVERKLTR